MSSKSEPSITRPCWSVFPFTKFCVAFSATLSLAANYLAFEVPCAGMQGGEFEIFSRFEHGWPVSYCRRETWREVPDSVPTTVDASPWTPWLDAQDVMLSALALDVGVAVVICLVVGILSQQWRSKRNAIWQFTIADFLWLSGFVGVCLAWNASIREQQKERRILNEHLQEVAMAFEVRGAAVPVFLPDPIKALYHRHFDRVLKFDADGDAQLATGLRHLLVLSRPEPNAALGTYLRRLPQLEAIDFHRVRLHGEVGTGLLGLRKLPAMPQLEGVNLYQTDANDDDLLWLANCQQLEHICLLDTEITDEGLKRICHLPRLRFLDVRSERLTNDGCRFIAEMSSLEELNIGSDSISDEGVESLARLKKLRTLELHTSASEAAVRRLRESLPRCAVRGR